MKKSGISTIIFSALLLMVLCTSAQPGKELVLEAAKNGTPLQPAMWGIFFEDINLGADGGIYAELVKNRSFEFTKPLMGWKVIQQPYKEGVVQVINQQHESPDNPRFVRLKLPAGPGQKLALVNEGFRGMGIRKDNNYYFSLLYRLPANATAALSVSLVSGSGKVIGGLNSGALAVSPGWQKVSFSFTAADSAEKASLQIELIGKGELDLDFISLFPADTWKGRKGGLRADMVQMLADLKPGFLRFPGGCIVEGHDLSNRYQWKKTIGPVEQRALKINRWNFEFGHRPAPDYFQTFGLGFFEYFQLAEDIGAEPLPILNCGMACQFNSAELVPLDQLEPYIQDALDLIEFANGDGTTTWGAKRVAMGHPEPFHLKMLGVGNENWGPQYLERLELFKKAIHAKYPYVKIIGSSGTDPEGERFEELNTGLRKMGIDYIDEHYYRKPGWFFDNAGRYDKYPRNGPRIFAGEYAGHDEKITEGGPQKSTWRAALAEAAFLTGLERNADVVHLASYAPLFGHIDGWQWSPNLIWVNNLKVMGTPEYHVQKLFSTNKGTHLAKVTLGGNVLAGADSLYASAVYDSIGRQLIVKVANAKRTAEHLQFTLPANLKASGVANIHQMQADNLLMHNSLEKPDALLPLFLQKAFASGKLFITIPSYSFSVIKIPWH